MPHSRDHLATKQPKAEGIILIRRNHRILHFNEPVKALLGNHLPSGQAQDIESIIHPEDRRKLAALIDRVFSDGQASEAFEIRFTQDVDAPQIPTMVCRLSPLFSPENGHDCASMNLYHKASAPGPGVTAFDPASPDNNHLLEYLPEGVFTINKQWRISWFNRTAEKITGFRREEVIGRHCWEIFKSDLCDVGCPLRTALEKGRISMDQDVRIITKGGKKLSILVNAGVIKDSEDRIAGAVETFRLLVGESIRPDQGKMDYAFSDIVGNSPAMKQLFSMLPDVAASEANVLICGESGTGKDLFARTIHNHSSRRDKPFIAVNCTALAESLLESEMFGHEKAAFTGALSGKRGRFELAEGGTIFLDEIGELKPEIQIKLLRVLEQREFERVGGTRTIPMKARIIAATNKDLHAAMARGEFREDLYYRLRTVPLFVPPLRERPEDIPHLVTHFIHLLNKRHDKQVRTVSPNVMSFLQSYHWPGNVRELERTLEYAYVFVKGTTLLKRFLPAAEEFSRGLAHTKSASPGRIRGDSVSPEQIQRALDKALGNRSRASAILGISRTSLWRRMKALGIS